MTSQAEPEAQAPRQAATRAFTSGIGLKARAGGPTFTAIDFPGAVTTLATDINDSGQIVGEYTSGGLGDRHGFLLDGGAFISIDYPGATFTRAVAINRYGDIVGDH